MDAAYYEDLIGQLYGLVIRLSDRLPADQAQWLHHVIDVGEYGLALDDMAGMLAHGQIAITSQERRDMLALADQMKRRKATPSAALSSPARGPGDRPGPGRRYAPPPERVQAGRILGEPR